MPMLFGQMQDYGALSKRGRGMLWRRECCNRSQQCVGHTHRGSSTLLPSDGQRRALPLGMRAERVVPAAALAVGATTTTAKEAPLAAAVWARVAWAWARQRCAPSERRRRPRR